MCLKRVDPCFTGLSDPVKKGKWGDPTSQMALIAKYKRAMADLRQANPHDKSPSL